MERNKTAAVGANEWEIGPVWAGRLGKAAEVRRDWRRLER